MRRLADLIYLISKKRLADRRSHTATVCLRVNLNLVAARVYMTRRSRILGGVSEYRGYAWSSLYNEETSRAEYIRAHNSRVEIKLEIR